MDATEQQKLSWAQNRKRAGETVMVSTCPCCKTELAIYLNTSSTVEIVPDTTPATQQLPLELDDR